MESKEYTKFDMGRICEYCFILIVGVVVIMTGNVLMGPDPDNLSLVGTIVLIAGIGIIILLIIKCIVDPKRHPRIKE